MSAPLAAGELERLLAATFDAARRAGEAIMEIYAGDIAVTRKADASPVTLADARAETIILAALAAAAPGIPVVAEEQAEADGLPAETADLFWLVDPLDGTKEFISRNGEFTVNIGLIQGGRPLLGMVHVPALGVTYGSAGAGTARRWRGATASEPIAARRVPPGGLVVVHSRSHENNEKFDAYLVGKNVAEKRVCGSSVKFCLLAAGEADLYPRFGPTMEWDTAAGHAVLLAAGGSVTTLEGAPFGYGKPGLRNPGFIARGLR
ncbi:MAG TPA: 3'(2'),5'-bisphosphate nucleotidase CysQ, partial [Stellaceae bacterium]|nr:3'(2'),5'-bisphosphate nucleotidase CysQ [Stellaceae bacterium]